MDHLDLRHIAEIIRVDGAGTLWQQLKEDYQQEYNMLLLASLEMQAKELEQLRANSS